MKILSRPKVEQLCAPIVENALRPLLFSADSPGGGHRGGAILATPISLFDFEKQIKLVFFTLSCAKVLTHYEIGTPREERGSTYENEKWLIRVKFTNDVEKKTGYIADLKFKYTRQT